MARRRASTICGGGSARSNSPRGDRNGARAAAAPLERDEQSGQVSTNFGNVDLGARYPLYEYVDLKHDFDTTFGVGRGGRRAGGLDHRAQHGWNSLVG
ncbi:MAG: hypothetical protein WDO13_17955 [Verrucomicrobiota bacterium]